MVDGQLLLEGFQEERPASTLDEEEAEMRLHAIRKEKIKKFKLAAVEEPAFPAESPVEPSPALCGRRKRAAGRCAKRADLENIPLPRRKAPLRSLLRRRAAIEERRAAGAWLTELSLIICGILPQAFAFFQGRRGLSHFVQRGSKALSSDPPVPAGRRLPEWLSPSSEAVCGHYAA